MKILIKLLERFFKWWLENENNLYTCWSLVVDGRGWKFPFVIFYWVLIFFKFFIVFIRLCLQISISFLYFLSYPKKKSRVFRKFSQFFYKFFENFRHLFFIFPRVFSDFFWFCTNFDSFSIISFSSWKEPIIIKETKRV